MPYSHPKYRENRAINGGSIYQMEFNPREKRMLNALERKESAAHFYFSAGPWGMFAPLLGIPYPHLTLQRLQLLHKNGVRRLAHFGGSVPPELVPYNINHEVMARFQLDPEADPETIVPETALQWTDEKGSLNLTEAWKLVERAILAFPIITPLYSTMGFTWYRLWARPLVPDIEKIPERERAYYEDFMCTTPHNPNNVDLSRDVLFQLTTPAKAAIDVKRMDKSVWNPLDKAIRILQEARADQPESEEIFSDQEIRLRALYCWLKTQRNVAAWIGGVHGFMKARQERSRSQFRNMVRGAIADEMENSQSLIDLLNTGIPFMAMSACGETPLMYGDNLRESLHRRIRLMKRHMEDVPRIDPDYMFRKAAQSVQSGDGRKTR